MVLHMFIHSMMAGAASFLILGMLSEMPAEWMDLSSKVLIGGIIANILVMTIEVSITHPTEDAKTVVRMIVKGRYANLFWVGVIVLTNILPLILLWSGMMVLILAAAVLTIIGIYITEKIWVEAPQRIPLT